MMAKQAGAVAVQQAMRFHYGLSYRRIAVLMKIHHRTAWQHCAAHEGSHVTAWGKRNAVQQSDAIYKALEVITAATYPHFATNILDDIRGTAYRLLGFGHDETAGMANRVRSMWSRLFGHEMRRAVDAYLNQYVSISARGTLGLTGGR